MRQPYWEVVVAFRVHGKGKTLYGDGFALWYTQERLTYGPVFGSKNGFKGLGMFFDTYSNHQGDHNHAHPFVSAMVSNGSLLYDHDSDGTHTQLDGCHMSFRNTGYSLFINLLNNKFACHAQIIQTSVIDIARAKKKLKAHVKCCLFMFKSIMVGT